MRTLAASLVTSQVREWPFVRNAIWVLVAFIFIADFGSTIEQKLFPVVSSQSVSDVMPENGGRLCWDWNFFKSRDALLLGAYAQLYSGDRENPMSVGIEREKDGTPFGMAGWLSNQVERVCIRVPPNAWLSYRLGIQPKLIYRDVPFWTINQDGPWVDYYSSIGHH